MATCVSLTPTATPTATNTPAATSTATTTQELAGIASDRAALVAFYNATDGDNWTNNTNWLSVQPIGDWHGITTNADGRVAAIVLSGNLVGGTLPNCTLPNSIGDLSELRTLDLSWNRGLRGAIPSTLGNLSKLEQLDLRVNFFTGSIPTSLGNLANLRELVLDWNDLSGSIPSALGNLASLRTLYLHNNRLSGSIPAALGNLANLQYFSAGYNDLSGSVPTELGNLANLQDLYLNSNRLANSIPTSLGNLTNLTRLNLWDNALTGTIPPELGNLRQLFLFYLGQNQLTGDIPSSLGNFANIKYLLLSGNSLTGCLPAVWRDLPEHEEGNSPTQLHDLTQLNLPYCDAVTDTPQPHTATHIPTAAPTLTHTPPPTPTATAAPRAGCIQVGPGAYWLFPQNKFLSGLITQYASSKCEDVEATESQIGSLGFVHTNDGVSAAAALCTAAHGGTAHSALQQAYPTTLFACVLAAPSETPSSTITSSPTATNTSVPPTNTPVQVTDSRAVTNVQLASNQPGELTVSWNAPSDPPGDYRVTYAPINENFKAWTDLSGNAFPTSTSITLTGLDLGVSYKVKVRARYSGSSGDWSASVEALIMAEPTDTPVPPTNTPVPPSEFCVLVGPGTYWLFPSDRFLSGLVTVYPRSDCEDFEITQTSIGDNGYAYTADGQAAAESLCAAGHSDGLTYNVIPVPANTDVWQCTITTPTDTPTPTSTPIPPAQATPVISFRPISATEWAELLETETNTPLPTATNTQVPPTSTNTSVPVNSRAIPAVRLSSNQPGVLEVSWDAPSETPDDYRINWARADENFPSWTENYGNAYPTSRSYTITGLDEGVHYKVKVRARYSGSAGDWSASVEALIMAEPTDTPVPPTNTPVPPTDTPVPPTDTPVPPTNTPVPPTNTPVPPTNTPVPPTDTPVPPTNTPVPPTNTPIPPTNTPVPPTTTNVTNPRKIPAVAVLSPPDGPSFLQVSWTAPSETPHDYRINWAKVGESFLTWTDLSGNAFPTSPSYTVTGLDGTASYKIRVRARYNGSAGPWIEIEVGSASS